MEQVYRGGEVARGDGREEARGECQTQDRAGCAGGCRDDATDEITDGRGECGGIRCGCDPVEKGDDDRLRVRIGREPAVESRAVDDLQEGSVGRVEPPSEWLEAGGQTVANTARQPDDP